MDYGLNPLPDDKILDSSKLKQSADDNFRFDVNSRKFTKLVENTVGKGEIAHYEQFLLFPQCFQKACFPGVSKGVVVWEWVKSFFQQSFSYICVPVVQFMMLTWIFLYKTSHNIPGKFPASLPHNHHRNKGNIEKN